MNVVGNAYSRVCLSQSPVCALTSESLDLETSFLVCKYILRISRSNLYINVIGLRSQVQKRSHMSINTCRYTFAGGLPSIEAILLM